MNSLLPARHLLETQAVFSNQPLWNLAIAFANMVCHKRGRNNEELGVAKDLILIRTPSWRGMTVSQPNMGPHIPSWKSRFNSGNVRRGKYKWDRDLVRLYNHQLLWTQNNSPNSSVQYPGYHHLYHSRIFTQKTPR